MKILRLSSNLSIIVGIEIFLTFVCICSDAASDTSANTIRPAPSLEFVGKPDSFVRFHQRGMPKTEGLIIDIVGDEVVNASKKSGGKLSVRLSNVSSNDVVILLHPSPISLDWCEIRTKKELYKFCWEFSVRGPNLWPVQSVLLAGNTNWRHDFFAVAENFDLSFPRLGDIKGFPVISADTELDILTPELVMARIRKEEPVSGTVELRCDMVYFIVGEKTWRRDRVSQTFPVGADVIKSQVYSE